jgi:hypothetical protein
MPAATAALVIVASEAPVLVALAAGAIVRAPATLVAAAHPAIVIPRRTAAATATPLATARESTLVVPISISSWHVLLLCVFRV